MLHNRASQDYKDLWEVISLMTWILKKEFKESKTVKHISN